MNVPEKVKEAAKGLIAMYGSRFKHLGKSDDADFYMFKFPDDEDTGFPCVYQYENGTHKIKCNLMRKGENDGRAD